MNMVSLVSKSTCTMPNQWIRFGFICHQVNSHNPSNLPATLASVCEEDALALSVSFWLIYWRLSKKKIFKKSQLAQWLHQEWYPYIKPLILLVRWKKDQWTWKINGPESCLKKEIVAANWLIWKFFFSLLMHCQIYSID